MYMKFDGRMHANSQSSVQRLLRQPSILAPVAQKVIDVVSGFSFTSTGSEMGVASATAAVQFAGGDSESDSDADMEDVA